MQQSQQILTKGNGNGYNFYCSMDNWLSGENRIVVDGNYALNAG